MKLPHIKKVSCKVKQDIQDNFVLTFDLYKELTPLQLSILFAVYNLSNVALPASKKLKHTHKAHLKYCNIKNSTLATKLQRSEKYFCAQISQLKKLGIIEVIRHNKLHYKRVSDNAIHCLLDAFKNTKTVLDTLPVYKERIKTVLDTLPVYKEVHQSTSILPEKVPDTVPETVLDTLPVYKRDKENKENKEEVEKKESVLTSSSSYFFNFFNSFFHRPCNKVHAQKFDNALYRVDLETVQYICRIIRKDGYYKEIESSTKLESVLLKQLDTIIDNARILRHKEKLKLDKESKKMNEYASRVLEHFMKFNSYYKKFGIVCKDVERLKLAVLSLYRRKKVLSSLAVRPSKDTVIYFAYIVAHIEYQTHKDTSKATKQVQRIVGKYTETTNT